VSDLTLEQIVEVIEAGENSNEYVDLLCGDFIREHHATIQKNAEDAKRLKALEKAMDWIGQADGSPVDQIRKRADEILREGEPHDQD
jgi:hypothetical protein